MNEATHISLVRLFNAIKDAVNEMDRCPKDSIEDIWNEMLDKWQTGLRMDRNYNIEPNAEAHGRRSRTVQPLVGQEVNDGS